MSTIESVAVEPLDLPLKEPFEIALGTRHEAHNVLVTVETSTGVRGYGEGSPLAPVTGETRNAAIETARAAAGLIEGTDLGRYRDRIEAVREAFPGAVSALFAVETAVLDAYCRERDLPLSALFGGVPTAVETDLTIPITDAAVAHERAVRAAEEGFDRLKVKTGTDPADDAARVEAVAAGAPEATLTVDANQGWTPTATERFVAEITRREVDLALLEQPVPAADLVGLARVRDAVSIPVAADEAVFTPADAMDVVRAEAADVINLKLGKSGPLAAAEIAAVARAANLEVMVGCMLESAVGIHTSAHVVAGLGCVTHIDLDGNRLLAEDVIERESGPVIDVGSPGHGVIPDRA